MRVATVALLLSALCVGCEPSYYCATAHAYTRDCQTTKAECEELLARAKKERRANPSEPVAEAVCTGVSSVSCFSTDVTEPSRGVVRCYADVDSCMSAKKWIAHEQGAGPQAFSSCRAGLKPTPVSELD